MSEPTEEEIGTVISVTNFGNGEDRAVVIQALKSCGMNTARVINEWYEDNSSFIARYTQKWDDSMFGGERDAPQQAPQSYHVEAPYQGSEVIQGVDPSQLTAPSRPPSRTNGQGLDSISDWASKTAGVADVWDQEVPTNQEDKDLEEALRQSRETAHAAGIEMPQQESGVTGMDAPVTAPSFGPATRDYYDQNDWAMTFAGDIQQASHQVEVAPSKRERKMGAPAFLVDAPDRAHQSKLGAYLTILHEIPLARNLYLKGASEDVSYGNDPQWWKGEIITRPHALGDGEEGELEWQDMDPSAEVRDELHRLMAFLDSTTRSYATVDGLVKLRPNLDSERQFHEEFSEYFQDEETVEPFFTKVCIEACLEENNRSVDDSSNEEEVQPVHSFDLRLSRANYSGVTNLYGLLDSFMWTEALERGEQPISECRMAILQDEADIFTINFGGVGPVVSVDIPEVFYRERWLSSRKEEALKIMAELHKLKKLEFDANQEKLRLWNAPGLGDKRSFLINVKERFDGYREYLNGRARFNAVEESEFDADKYPEYHMAPCDPTEEEKALDAKLQEAAEAAQKTLEDGRRRSEELTEELNRIQKKRQALSRLLTDPDKKGRPKPMTCKKYLLQGVATKSNVVYVCKRAQEDLIELSDAPQKRDQWWRLELNPQDGSEPVKTEMQEFEVVASRMWEETKNPLLVYASEAAARTEPTALPASLERFVKADNKAFQQELNQEVSDAVWEGDMQAQGNGIPFSPTKRKHRDSIDSMNSNRPSVGSVDGNASDDPFLDETRNSSPLRAQKRQSPGASSPLDVPPPLPKRSGSTEQTSTAQTPKTTGGGATPDTQQTTPLHAINGTGEAAKPITEAKAPEMQQRPQASIFLNRDNKTDQSKSTDEMDIDG